MRQIVDEYPYFHIARMLYLKNLAVLNDIRFAAELKRMAVYIPDRRKLFTLIEGERYGMAFRTASDKEETSAADSFSLIEAFLADRESEGDSVLAFIVHAVSIDPADFSESLSCICLSCVTADAEENCFFHMDTSCGTMPDRVIYNYMYRWAKCYRQNKTPYPCKARIAAL